jgi:hypothetical protein
MCSLSYDTLRHVLVGFVAPSARTDVSPSALTRLQGTTPPTVRSLFDEARAWIATGRWA